jgi:hypothetical protein
VSCSSSSFCASVGRLSKANVYHRGRGGPRCESPTGVLGCCRCRAPGRSSAWRSTTASRC